jgi:hypothetical protein
MKRHLKFTIGAVIAGLCMTLAAVPASADPPTPAAYRSCSTTGASGTAHIWAWYVGITSVPLDFNVDDTLADDHHVQIRVIAKDLNTNIIYYPWHKVYTGYGTGASYSSTAKFSAGLGDLGIEVARFEGDTMLNYCRDWINTGHT